MAAESVTVTIHAQLRPWARFVMATVERRKWLLWLVPPRLLGRSIAKYGVRTQVR